MKLLIPLMIGLAASPALANKALITWNPNLPEEGVFGYEVFERIGTTDVLLGFVTTNRAAVVNLPAGSHCFVVVAFGYAGESLPSKEACVQIASGSLNAVPVLDIQFPRSSMEPLPERSLADLTLRWSAQEEMGGSGVDVYDIYVSTNGGPWKVWLAQTTLTTGTFRGLPDNHYGFLCVATDRAGNRSPLQGNPQPQAATRVVRPNTSTPRFSPSSLVYGTFGTVIIVTNRVTDADVPAQILRYELLGNPSNATVHHTSGLLFFRPTHENAMSTNYFWVKVTDNGVPPLSATQKVAIVLRDFLDIEMSETLGFPNQTIDLPVFVFSTTPVSSVSFKVEIPDSRLQNLEFRTVQGTNMQTTVVAESPTRLRIAAWGWTESVCGYSCQLGNVRFRLNHSQSEFLPVRVFQTEARRTNGTSVGTVLGNDGRVVFLGTGPLLETSGTSGDDVTIVLHGIPGRRYAVEYRMEPPGAGTWNRDWDGTLTGFSQVFVYPRWALPRAFFRARRLD